MRKSSVLYGKCALTSFIQQSDIIKDISWDSSKAGINIPTQPSSVIINSLNQVYKATSEILVKEDLDKVFSELLLALKEKYLDKIKTDVIIRTELGYKYLCDELDFVADGAKGVFYEKLKMDLSILTKSIKDIENVKTAHLF